MLLRVCWGRARSDGAGRRMSDNDGSAAAGTANGPAGLVRSCPQHLGTLGTNNGPAHAMVHLMECHEGYG
jgi:hypothetical protein